MNKANLAILLATLLTFSEAATADDAEGRPKWRIIIENDVLALDSWTGLNDDRNYTMGVLVSSYKDYEGESRFSGALRWFDSVVFPGSSNDDVDLDLYSYDYGVSAFTPNMLQETQPIQGDRPHACVTLGAKNRIRTYGGDDGTARRTKLVVGILGLDICKAVQRFLHNQAGISNQDPIGWSNQISEGGEPTAMYSSEYVNLLSRKPYDTECANYEVATNYGYNLGYYTNVFAGISLRAGRVCSPYYAWSANPASYFALEVDEVEGDKRPRDHFVFLSYQARVVGYNVLLQGQFRDSVVTFSGSQIENLVHEASAGWTLQRKSRSSFTYALHYRSAEFEGPLAREHWYGSLVYTKAF